MSPKWYKTMISYKLPIYKAFMTFIVMYVQSDLKLIPIKNTTAINSI